MRKTLDKLNRLSDSNDKSVAEIGLKLSEEAGEVAEAILGTLRSAGCDYKGKEVDDVKEESIDALMVAYSLFRKVGGTEEEFVSILNQKMTKWEATTK